MKHIKISTQTKEVDFLDQKVEIKQLTVKQVKQLQKELDKNTKSKVDSLDTLAIIFKAAVVGAEEMKNSDFEDYPLPALTELSKDILEFNGLGASDNTGGTLGK